MKPRGPDESGDVDRDGVRIHWERYGDGDTTVILLPTWVLFPIDHWKFQVPYLGRRLRTITIEGRGRGRSDAPTGADAYTLDEYVADIVAVLDATGTDHAVLVGLSRGAMWAIGTAATRPDRVSGIVAIAPAVPVAGMVPLDRTMFEADLDTTDGWAKYNARHWRRDYADFVSFFVGQMFPEPHSTKALEDGVAWGTAADVEMMIGATCDAHLSSDSWFRSVVGRVDCPVLVVHGAHDRVRPHSAGAALAELTGGDLVTIVGAGHAPHLRDPVFVNRIIRDFAERAGSGRHRPAAVAR
jgi:pimeloyl-ACP methyl ester carboxylesterase